MIFYVRLQYGTPALVGSLIQSQEHNGLPKVVHTPEAFRLAVSIGARQPWQAKGAFVERPVGVLNQELLNLGSGRLLDDYFNCQQSISCPLRAFNKPHW